MEKGKNTSSIPADDNQKIEQEKTIYTWKSLERPYVKKDREFWTTAIAILALVFLILFLVGEWLFIASIIAFVFLYYTLTTVRPRLIEHRITNKGIYYADSPNRYDWDLLKSFWWTEKWGYSILNIEGFIRFPGVLQFVVNEPDKKQLEKVVSAYLEKEDEIKKRNFMDKSSDWLMKNLPLESKK
jgi:hypothetical protein